jgi:hypothetical protein
LRRLVQRVREIKGAQDVLLWRLERTASASSSARISNKSFDLGDGKSRHHGAPVRTHRNQAFGVKLPQRLAHRHAAGAKTLRDLRRIDECLGRQIGVIRSRR